MEEQMKECPRCQGEGETVFEEDNREVVMPCYACSGTGKASQEDLRHSKLEWVAWALAYQQETEYSHACNSDPEGEGYYFYAAENMMSPFEYFRGRVWDRYYPIAERLAEMDPIQQDVLIAWNESLQ